MTEQNREYILKLFKIVSTTSILVVTPAGRLKRLHSPFKVVAAEDIPPAIIKGNSYLVDSVKMTLNLKEVFIIRGKGYAYSDFTIKGI
jgi:hypothetical protein